MGSWSVVTAFNLEGLIWNAGSREHSRLIERKPNTLLKLSISTLCRLSNSPDKTHSVVAFLLWLGEYSGPISTAVLSRATTVLRAVGGAHTVEHGLALLIDEVGE